MDATGRESNGQPKSSTPVQHIPTQQAYDQWADVYDTDGNMLQSIDDLELSTLLPETLSTVVSAGVRDTASANASPSNNRLTLIDLGCGTGRNTAKLLSYDWPSERLINIIGLDFSQCMLDVAAKKLQGAIPEKRRSSIELRLWQCDCFPTVSDKTASPVPPAENLETADAVISTLVLEHVPLKDYFATLAALVRQDGYAFVTNMHSEMGRISQAGFVNAQGVKVRGQSFAHTPQEAVDEARRAGFEVIELKERRVEESDIESGLVGKRGRKWVGVMVWFGLVLRKL
jgi:SAM-dependent methyltransferase